MWPFKKTPPPPNDTEVILYLFALVKMKTKSDINADPTPMEQEMARQLSGRFRTLLEQNDNDFKKTQLEFRKVYLGY